MSTATNPFALEVRRLAPQLGLGVLGITTSTITDESSLRAVLVDLPREAVDRAVRRALAWETLTPLERAILDLPMNRPMRVPEQLAALPEEVRPVAPGDYAWMELEIVLASMHRRGLLEMSGVDAAYLELLEAFGEVPQAERMAIYADSAATEAAWAKDTAS